MPRQARVDVGDEIYHVINRSNGRVKIFHNDSDYRHFESLLREAKELTNMRILAYCIMPNHWHLILYPRNDNNLSEFMRWLTTTHVRQVRAKTNSIGQGHLYQGAYKSFIVEAEKYLVQLIRYIEQNPLRAKMIKRAQDWEWSSLYVREKGNTNQKKILDSLPVDLPVNYIKTINEMCNEDVLESIRYSVLKGKPFGSVKWTDDMIEMYKLGSTLRQPGRPKKG
ncbi:MAG: transposase [Patescibacteria group bacterium]